MPQRSQGKCQVLGRQQKTGLEGQLGEGLYWGFHGEGSAGQVNGFGWTSVSDFSGLEATGAVPGCLVLGPGMIKAEESCLLAI